MAKITETPLMKQYQEMKKKYPDAILLFRVGDFYETFSDDAIAVSDICGVTLTRRSNGSASSVELAGFPHHALDTYLQKLTRAGKRVAICEQLENPKLTDKVVKRGNESHNEFEERAKREITAMAEQYNLSVEYPKNPNGFEIQFFDKDRNSQGSHTVICGLNSAESVNDTIKDIKKWLQEKYPEVEKKPKLVKEINCICDIDQMREKGEPIAYFTIDIPKEAKNLGKCVNKKKNSHLPQLLSICVEPENNKLIVTDTSVLQTIDAKCEGIWPQGEWRQPEGFDHPYYVPFQCNIDPKAINALAGKLVDVAVWEKDGKLDITACEANGVRSQYAEASQRFPDWKRVIPKSFDCNIKLSKEDVAKLVAWLKKNVGKTTPDSYGEWTHRNSVQIDITPLSVKFTMKIYNNENWKWEDGEHLEMGYDGELKSDSRFLFIAPLLLLSIDGDFNGEIGFSGISRPAVFFGKYRDSLLMSKMPEE